MSVRQRPVHDTVSLTNPLRRTGGVLYHESPAQGVLPLSHDGIEERGGVAQAVIRLRRSDDRIREVPCVRLCHHGHFVRADGALGPLSDACLHEIGQRSTFQGSTVVAHSR